VLQSLALFSFGAMSYLGRRLVYLHWAAWMAFPSMFFECGGVWSLALGILFLASWWKSRPSEGPEDTEHDAG
jgi:hypothetical protein